MKKITYLPSAQDALKKYRSIAPRILDKMEAYAADQTQFANIIKRLQGRDGVFRLRIGDFRVIFEESETEIRVRDVGPRGSIYE